MQDLEQIKKSIQQSALLSSVEKAEWVQLLPQMTENQIAELARILSTAAKPAEALRSGSFKMPDYKEKEIATSQPFYEPEIPARTGVGSVPPFQQPKPILRSEPAPEQTVAPARIVPPTAQPIVQPTVPQPQQPVSKPVSLASILAAQQAQAQRNAGSIPTAQKLQPSAVAAVPPPPKPPVKEWSLGTAEDFSKLDAAYLHEHDPHDVLKALMRAVVEISKKAKFFNVLTNLEKSSLYKTYVATGYMLLSDGSADRDGSYANIIKNAQANGQQYMTREEFEAFTDFRKELDKLFV